MLSALQPPRTAARTAERRRHHRMKVVLLGRYMLPNRMEYPCQSIDISPGGVHLAAPARANPGDRVIVYLEHLGRIE
ncbi:MAG: PilZ domain-containing protein, partial [Bosea sp. (in: a-proteobacteria)]|nr:PilZ domain-containing protein [Bosea sp. (in: a-proteobacteria)]